MDLRIADTGTDDLEAIRQWISQRLLAGGESRNNSSSGIQALMLAVFEDGLRSYLGPPGACRTEAEAWVSSRRSSTFSFNTVCDVVGLDPDAVRAALRQLRKDGRRPNRIRENARVDKVMGQIS